MAHRRSHGRWHWHLVDVYTAMLGFHLPVPVLYDWPTVIPWFGWECEHFWKPALVGA